VVPLVAAHEAAVKAGLIVMDRGAVALAPALSEALTEKDAVEPEVGVPEI
jgi:hypothetical protein